MTGKRIPFAEHSDGNWHDNTTVGLDPITLEFKIRNWCATHGYRFELDPPAPRGAARASTADWPTSMRFRITPR